MLNNYKNKDITSFEKTPAVTIYKELFSGLRKGLPKGFWQNDENVILIIRYVLEIKLNLSKEEIPKINKETIREQKLWGALNRFNALPKEVSLFKRVKGVAQR